MFWKDVLLAWSECNYSEVTTPESIANQILWYNSHIKVQKQFFFSNELYEKGVIYVKDLYLGNHLMRHEELCQMRNVRVSIMEYNSLISAIPPEWKRSLAKVPCLEGLEMQSKFGEMREYTKWSPIVYNQMIESAENFLEVVNKLSRMVQVSLTEDQVKRCFQNINKSTTIIKYRDFQYRLLHNTILTNNRLWHMKIAPTNKCDFCQEEVETIIHLLCNCKEVKNFWTEIAKYVQEMYHEDLEISILAIIPHITTHHVSEFNYHNVTKIVAKQHLY